MTARFDNRDTVAAQNSSEPAATNFPQFDFAGPPHQANVFPIYAAPGSAINILDGPDNTNLLVESPAGSRVHDGTKAIWQDAYSDSQSSSRALGTAGREENTNFPSFDNEVARVAGMTLAYSRFRHDQPNPAIATNETMETLKPQIDAHQAANADYAQAVRTQFAADIDRVGEGIGKLGIKPGEPFLKTEDEFDQAFKSPEDKFAWERAQRVERELAALSASGQTRLLADQIPMPGNVAGGVPYSELSQEAKTAYVNLGFRTMDLNGASKTLFKGQELAATCAKFSTVGTMVGALVADRIIDEQILHNNRGGVLVDAVDFASPFAALLPYGASAKMGIMVGSHVIAKMLSGETSSPPQTSSDALDSKVIKRSFST